MILFISIATLFLSLVQTFFNYKLNKSSLYLTGFLVPVSFFGILNYFYFINKSAWNLALFYGHLTPIFFITGPMLFFYVRSNISSVKTLSKKDFIHFIPSIIVFISILPYYFVDFKTKIKLAEKLIENPFTHNIYNISWLYQFNYNAVFHSVFLIGYIVLTFSILLKNSYLIRKKQIIQNLNDSFIIWLYVVNILAAICAIGYFILAIHFLKNSISPKSVFGLIYLNDFVSIIFGLIPITMLFFPKVIYGIDFPNNSKTNDDILSEVKIQKTFKIAEEDERENSEKLAKIIIDYLQKEKPFTDPNYSLEDLSIGLGIQKHHLYYCFNTVLNSRFTTIRTQMRVEYAKECLLNGDLNSLSMEGIWTKTGFSSRTSFFVSFKEITGMTPLDFIKNNKIESRKNKVS